MLREYSHLGLELYALGRVCDPLDVIMRGVGDLQSHGSDLLFIDWD